jgi:hypothetical protein
MILLVILGIAALFETPMSEDRQRVDFNSSITTAVEVEEEAEPMIPIPSLETELIKKEIIDGYVIETYQEFEVIRDKGGEIISSTPTSNYDYLRYFISKQ